MKKRILPLVFVTFLFAGLGSLWFSGLFASGDERAEKASNPATFIKAKEYLSRIRNNQVTGVLDPSDAVKARDQFREQTNLKAGQEVNLNWISMGPNNIGGRTRALLFDNRDTASKTIYAAGVTGGVFKSTNYGATWNKVNTEDGSSLKVTCMIQSGNGTIYAGTGEGFNLQNYSPLSDMGYMSGFVGQGIFKSDDGNTFTLVDGTAPAANQADVQWAYINEIAMDPSGQLWAADNTGIKVQNGGNWNYAQYTDTLGNLVDLMGLAYDIQINSNGAVIASVDGMGYVSVSGSPGGFVCISTGEEDGLSMEGVGRIEFAFAPSDPNVVYALAASIENDHNLENVYLSEDQGLTWRVVGPGNSNTLNILGSSFFVGSTENYYYQGDYNNTIAVFPENPYRILAGGVNLWEGVKVNETGYYQWAERSEGENIFPNSPIYAHVDHHTYVFRPGYGNEFLLGTDGGVFKGMVSGDFFSFESININYTTTQFYSVSPSLHFNEFIGGTQDNGTQHVSFRNNINFGSDMWLFGVLRDGGDGGYCEVSTMEAMFSNADDAEPVTFYSTSPLRNNDDLDERMRRSETYGDDFSFSFIVDDITNDNFLTPMALWEDYNTENSEIEVEWVAEQEYTAGESVMVRSNNRDQPFYHTLESDVNEGDTLYIKDIVQSKLFIATSDEVWMSIEALQFGVEPEWWLIANSSNSGFEGEPSCLAYSHDANYLFVGTYDGRLFRISNIAYAYSAEEADVTEPECIIATDEIVMVEGGLTQAITSISVDPADANKVMVTLGNYGNTDYVYYSENALSDVPEFESVQGNLPLMPVYAGILEMDPATSVALIGTDQGIWATDDVMSKQWTASLDGPGEVPVLQLKQQTVYKKRIVLEFEDPGTGEVIYETYPEVKNYGVIYAATYGKGVYADSTYRVPLGIEEPEPFENQKNLSFSVYPNPMYDMASVSITIPYRSVIKASVFDLNGRLVMNRNYGECSSGTHTLQLEMNRITTGTYILKVEANGITGSQKIIVK